MVWGELLKDEWDVGKFEVEVGLSWEDKELEKGREGGILICQLNRMGVIRRGGIKDSDSRRLKK